jgi:hypothetical protein
VTNTRPTGVLGKIATFSLRAGLVFIMIGIVGFAAGMQPVFITRIYHVGGIELGPRILGPKEHYTTRFLADLNEPPLNPLRDPTPYVEITFNITGNVTLFYRDPTGWNVSTSSLSGSGIVTLFPAFAGTSELLLENVRNTNANISHMHSVGYFFGLRENWELVGFTWIPVLIGLATASVGFALRLLGRAYSPTRFSMKNKDHIH